VINGDGGLPDTFREPPFQLPLLFPFWFPAAGDRMPGRQARGRDTMIVRARSFNPRHVGCDRFGEVNNTYVGHR
jgi:hypothetical protein